MKYGILMFPTQHPVDVAVVARQAEALGFASLWVGEHPIMPVHSASPFPGSPDGRIPDSYSWFLDPFVTLARASAVTTKLQLGRHHPHPRAQSASFGQGDCDARLLFR